MNFSNAILYPEKNKKKSSVDKNKVKKIFHEYGIVILRDFSFNENTFYNFADFFTKKYSVDAKRRKKTSIFQVNHVDEGYGEMSLHSETSFSPNWPEILWFFGKKVTKKNGETTFCCGNQLWKILSYKTKEFLKSNLLMFEVKSDIKLKLKNKKWDFNQVGIYDAFIDEEGFINYKHIKFAIANNELNKKIYLSSHILYKNTDPTIKSMTLINKKKIPKNIIREIEIKSKKITYYHKWKSNDVIMIDNKKFMHGRNKVPKNELREILNIQTLEKQNL